VDLPARPIASPAVTRVFSGIKPTGEMHLGNYVGAVRRWAEEQQRADAIYCVVDLHAMTVPYEPEELRSESRRLAMLLLAAGLDPERCIVFLQSHVPLVTELTWILNGVATIGELRRMTQFKDKGQGQESVSAGLFDYPVLMAADILLYDTDEVPVGEDQTQHVELARDIAVRFNHRFGENTLVVPRATIPPVGARIKDLQRPEAKMSKSVDSPQGTILVLDSSKAITKKVKSAVTDSGAEVRFAPDEKPGVSNLLALYASATGVTIPAAEAEFAGAQYGAFKGAVADALVEYLRPVRERYEELAADPGEVARILAAGAAKADAIATVTMERVRNATGLLLPGA
jgi:tryptophanyl-tRNA synthetase